MWCEFDAGLLVMIDLSKDIHSLSDFKRKTSEFMTRMKRSGRPVVLTINGKAEIVVQDAASYQRLLELAEQAEMMEFLRESREDMKAGRTEPALEALERLSKKHKLKQKGK
jgi:prevent-host-death family protein